jgi:hypothetical protein
MAFTLDRVVPWGRSFAEYQRMFALTPADLRRRILGCADGPASFNAEATRLGVNVISIDPLYAFGAAEIRGRIKKVSPEILEQTRQNRDGFVWTEFASIEELGRVRLRAMVGFLADYSAGCESGRYLTGELPRLPIDDRAFDLALCSHFLFLYSDQLSEQFHAESAVELCRVADEVRVFPLITLGNEPSPHVRAVIRAVERLGRKAEIVNVAYEFQRGGNQMLQITKF